MGRYLAIFLSASLLLVGGASAPAQTWGWVAPNPNNPRYLSFGDVPASITSYGSLIPCEFTGNEARDLKVQGANYARIWHYWSGCGEGNWMIAPWRGPWLLACDPRVETCASNRPIWNLDAFDDAPGSYWDTLAATVNAARETISDGTGKRLAVEIHFFQQQDFLPGRVEFNPFNSNNITNNDVSIAINSHKEFEKMPHRCLTSSGSDAVACKVWEIQKAYVGRLIDVTQKYGNVIYEIMNEPEVNCENQECRDDIAFWGEYWPQFVKDYLAAAGKARVVSSSELNGAFGVADVDVANLHFPDDYPFPFLTQVLGSYSSRVRNAYLTHQKVVNVDEFANGDWDPVRLRKKSWTIVLSGGHFHIEDPCVPGPATCPSNKDAPPNSNAKPWVPVQSIATFKTTSGWQFYRAKPTYRDDLASTRWFYWMIQDDPAYDTIGFGAAGVQDHVGYLAYWPPETCATQPLYTDLPATPVGAPEYVARLWDPKGTGYLRDGQGNVLEHRFVWSGGQLDWCQTPFRTTILSSDDLVFHVHAGAGASVILTVTKAGTGSGTVTSAPAGINCGSACSASFPSGAFVTLTPSPTGGSTFAGWSGECTGTGTCTVTMSASKGVTATFDTLPSYTLTVTRAGTGSGTVTSASAGINCGSTCSASFTSGTVVNLTASPTGGSTFAGWSGACTGTGTCTVTMSASRSVTATFNAGPNQPPAVTVSVSRSTCHPTPTTPCTATCTATAIDPDGDPLTYAWSGCAGGSGGTAVCSVPGLTAYTCTVLVSDGRGGSTQASKSVTGTNSPPSCVANGGQTLTVWHLDWTDGISLALFDADGDSIPGCTHVRSSNSQAIGIGPVYQNCTRNAPLFRFRPSCAGPPVSANLRVYVSDGWVETVCSVPMDCYLP